MRPASLLLIGTATILPAGWTVALVWLVSRLSGRRGR